MRNNHHIFLIERQNNSALNAGEEVSFGIGEHSLASERTRSSVHHTGEAGDASLVGVLRAVFHNKHHFRQCAEVLLHICFGQAHSHLLLHESLVDGELRLHLLVVTEHGHGRGRRNLVADTYVDATNDTSDGSRDGAEAEVDLSAVNRSLCLTNCSLCLLVVVLGVVEHIAADDVLGEQVLV